MSKIISKKIIPKCPYCEKRLSTIGRVKKKWRPITPQIYFCIFCEKLLSLAGNK